MIVTPPPGLGWDSEVRIGAAPGPEMARRSSEPTAYIQAAWRGYCSRRASAKLYFALRAASLETGDDQIKTMVACHAAPVSPHEYVACSCGGKH